MTIRVIGIGSPFGDDAAGLEAARILAQAPPPDCEVIAADRPGAALIELMAGVDAAILIDAVRSGAPAGTLHQLDFDELARASHRFVSSHDLGVAAAVGLARKLGQLPARGRVLGIEIAATPARMSDGLSPATRRALNRATELVRSWAREFASRPWNRGE